MVHYEETIKQKVSAERIYRFVSQSVRTQLDRIFSGKQIAVWGSRDSDANRSKFERMRPGDEILIVEGQIIKLLGKVAATTTNSDLSNELWQSLRVGQAAEGWNLIYFIANPVEINLPFTEFCHLMGYGENYQLRGFTTVSDDRLETFYKCYDDLYSILMQLKQNHPVYQRPQKDLFGEESKGVEEPEVTPIVDTPDQVAPAEEISDHLRMQWMLLNLGRKAGSKVWIPANDQGRIRDRFQYSEFERDFAAGIDAQTRYVENIDVVWKEEFRIDAAFEIENSTSIYSGLLRFSDLTLVAPNTIYPLFIVAPREKRNRLVEQLRRPTFQKLRLDRKVRYLPYEAVEEIDQFFGDVAQGLTVDVIVGRSEEINLHH